MGRHESHRQLVLPDTDLVYDERHEPLFSLPQLDYIGASLTDISVEHGPEGLLRRFELQAALSLREPDEIELAYDGLQLARYCHETSDNYKGEPYIVHPLRVAIRVMRDYDITSGAFVAAALNHDVVEDEPERAIDYLWLPNEYGEYVQSVDVEQTRADALWAIEQRIAYRTSRLVGSVTNPVNEPGLDKATKRQLYLENVQHEIMSDFDTFILKLSDFIENGVGLHHSEDPAKAMNVAGKYLPVYDVFGRAAEHYFETGRLTRYQYELTIRKLARGQTRAQQLLQGMRAVA